MTETRADLERDRLWCHALVLAKCDTDTIQRITHAANELRSARPLAAAEPKCETCDGTGFVYAGTGIVAGEMSEFDAPCPDCRYSPAAEGAADVAILETALDELAALHHLTPEAGMRVALPTARAALNRLTVQPSAARLTTKGR